MLRDGVVRVKLWTPDGRIVYSDEPRLIGARYPPDEPLEAGRVEAEVSDLSRPENRGLLMVEDDAGRLLARMRAYQPPPAPRWLGAGER